jgi:hypothetical protein
MLIEVNNMRIIYHILYAIIFIALLSFFIYISNINVLFYEKKIKLFNYENDIILQEKYYKKEYGNVKIYQDLNCYYWKGFGVRVVASSDIHPRSAALSCPILFRLPK